MEVSRGHIHAWGEIGLGLGNLDGRGIYWEGMLMHVWMSRKIDRRKSWSLDIQRTEMKRSEVLQMLRVSQSQVKAVL